MNPVPADVLSGLTEKLTNTVLFKKASFIANPSNERRVNNATDTIANQQKRMAKPPFHVNVILSRSNITIEKLVSLQNQRYHL
jgi:hypothetical protein